MISLFKVSKFCKEYPSMIENYDKAMEDKYHIWHCHHKLEIGSDYNNTVEDLKLMNLYYNRPACEFIFLTSAEHNKLHNTNMSSTKRNNLSKAMAKVKHTEEWNNKVSNALKGHTGYYKDKKFETEHKDNISSSLTKYWEQAKINYNKYKEEGGTLTFKEWRSYVRNA